MDYSGIQQWQTIEQAAQVMQVSTKTVRRRIKDGTIEARRFGPRLIRLNPATYGNIGTPVD